jgi:hypothetical protein
VTEDELAEQIVLTIKRAIAPVKEQLARLDERVMLAPRLADLEAHVHTLTEQVIELRAQLAARETVR